MKLRRADPDVVVDDARARVVRWDLPPGSAIGHHRHPWDYLVIPVMGGTLTFTDAAGDREVVLESGRVRSAPAGVQHDVSNRSDAPVVFVEVELKDAQDPD